MILNKDGKVLNLNINDNLIIGSGFYGRVYKISGDTCFKYYSIVPDYYTESYIELIKSWNYDNLYKIYDMCYENGRFVGYTMKYYVGTDIMTLKSRYIFDNFMELEKVIKMFSQYGYILTDLHSENVIVTKDNFVLIDCDNLTPHNTFNRAYYFNMEYLRNIFSIKICEGLMRRGLLTNKLETRIDNEVLCMDSFKSDELLIDRYTKKRGLFHEIKKFRI